MSEAEQIVRRNTRALDVLDRDAVNLGIGLSIDLRGIPIERDRVHAPFDESLDMVER